MKILQLFRNNHDGVSGRGLDLKSLWFLACLLAIILNAVVYTWMHCNPLVTSDAWYFLDVFVRKVVAGDVSVTDFFVKRAGVDHSQPLNKLVLYLDVVGPGMDFTYEGLTGLLFAIGGLWLIFLIVSREIPKEHADPHVLVCLLAIAAIFLSLNSSEIYTWSLVTLGYSLHLFALWLIWLSWRSLQTSRWRALLFGGVIVGVCADDSAFIIIAACSAGMLFAGFRLGRLRDALRVVAMLLLALLVARLIYAGLHYSTQQTADAGPAVGEQLAALRQRLPEAGRWLLIPSAAALVYEEQLKYFFPDHWQSWQLAVGLLVLAGQVWFWLSIWRVRANGIVFTAVCLMLLAYGYWAGIIYGRVTTFGSDYLYQARYVLLYVQVPIALLLLAIERLSGARIGRPEKSALTLVAVGVIALQLPLSLVTWRNATSVDNYYQNTANQMFALARNPAVVPKDCVPIMTVCQWPEAERADLFRIMETYRLNLFSREFDDRHGMYPGDAK